MLLNKFIITILEYRTDFFLSFDIFLPLVLFSIKQVKEEIVICGNEKKKTLKIVQPDKMTA
jgi:hypothetical protein